MNKLLLSVMFMLLYTATSQAGPICKAVVKQMDRTALSSDYRKIAWYAYRHKMKLDYLQKNYALLEKVRNSNSSDMEYHSANSDNIVSIPTVEMAAAEAETMAAINTINLSLLDLLLYKSIKEEISNNRLKSLTNQQTGK